MSGCLATNRHILLAFTAVDNPPDSLTMKVSDDNLKEPVKIKRNQPYYWKWKTTAVICETVYSLQNVQN